jgi:hypothetical protein
VMVQTVYVREKKETGRARWNALGWLGLGICAARAVWPHVATLAGLALAVWAALCVLALMADILTGHPVRGILWTAGLAVIVGIAAGLAFGWANLAGVGLSSP